MHIREDALRVASIRAAAWEKVQPHLSEAADQENELRKQCIERVQGFIDARKKGAKKFAEAALGFWSKWALVKSKIPYLRLANLAPAIVERFMANDQPEEPSLVAMRKDIPLLWSEQEECIAEWVVPVRD